MSGAIAAGALVVGSSIYSARQQKKAGEAAARAQEAGGELIYQQFKDTEARLAPYSDAGLPAFQQQQALSGALGPVAQRAAFNAYQESPGVAFLRERGLRGIERSAAAGGDLFGGNVEKAKIDYSQGLALQDFGNYFNRLGAITGTGLAAAQAIGGVGGQAAQGQAQMIAGAGADRAAARIGATNSYMSGLQMLGGGLSGFSGGNTWQQNLGGFFGG